VAFTIADGELPGNTGAGYVVRRILRRAVRYYYSFLDWKEPLLYAMVSMLADYFSEVFPELMKQKDFVQTVILEEERSFLRTLESGLKRFENIQVNEGVINGQDAFELYDTFGFPIDLTRLIAGEKGFVIDEKGFEKALQAQKDRSREDARAERGDWEQLLPDTEVEFVGYDKLQIEDARLIKYREVIQKNRKQVQIVLDRTPFYAEGGGQIGDSGILDFGGEKIKVLDTVRENDLIIHIAEKVPSKPGSPVIAKVDVEKRRLTENNHSATHLLQAALRKVLGTHAQQRGSLVSDKYLRFDFSHFQKMSREEIAEVEALVNQKIRENISRREDAGITIAEAEKAGAMMLFGEKYGETVRMITFDPAYSAELCGGCHVGRTGQIGSFKIISESAIAAGIRRIEAITSVEAEKFINRELDELNEIRSLLKSSGNAAGMVSQLQEENKALRKQVEKLMSEKAADFQDTLKNKIEEINGVRVLAGIVPLSDTKALKTLSYNLEKELGNILIAFGMESDGKPQLMITISQSLTEKGYHAGTMIREIAKEINGGGGGQAFFASAGGSDPSGLKRALERLKNMI